LAISPEAMKVELMARVDHPELRDLELEWANSCKCATSNDTEHARNCRHHGSAIRRHNLVAAEINLMLSSAGCTTVYDAKALPNSTNTAAVTDDRRPDIIAQAFDHDGRNVIVEVAVINPAAVSVAPPAAKKPCYAAEMRERSKTDKYADIALENNARILVTVVEVPGAFGPGLRTVIAMCQSNFVRDGKQLPEDIVPWAAPTFGTYWSQRIAVARVRGNYAMVAALVRATSTRMQ
jgi:hypothetical protein